MADYRPKLFVIDLAAILDACGPEHGHQCPTSDCPNRFGYVCYWQGCAATTQQYCRDCTERMTRGGSR